MSKEKLIAKLVKYQIKHSEWANSICINFGRSQELVVTFCEDNKVKIIDRFGKWNPLCGFFKISLRTALISQAVSNVCLWVLLLVTFIGLKLETMHFELVTMSLVCAWGFSIFWSTYYLIQLESFKRTLINWLDD